MERFYSGFVWMDLAVEVLKLLDTLGYGGISIRGDFIRFWLWVHGNMNPIKQDTHTHMRYLWGFKRKLMALLCWEHLQQICFSTVKYTGLGSWFIFSLNPIQGHLMGMWDYQPYESRNRSVDSWQRWRVKR